MSLSYYRYPESTHYKPRNGKDNNYAQLNYDPGITTMRLGKQTTYSKTLTNQQRIHYKYPSSHAISHDIKSYFTDNMAW